MCTAAGLGEHRRRPTACAFRGTSANAVVDLDGADAVLVLTTHPRVRRRSLALARAAAPHELGEVTSCRRSMTRRPGGVGVIIPSGRRPEASVTEPPYSSRGPPTGGKGAALVRSAGAHRGGGCLRAHCRVGFGGRRVWRGDREGLSRRRLVSSPGGAQLDRAAAVGGALLGQDHSRASTTVAVAAITRSRWLKRYGNRANVLCEQRWKNRRNDRRVPPLAEGRAQVAGSEDRGRFDRGRS